MATLVKPQLLGVYWVEGQEDVFLLELRLPIPPREVDVSSFTQEDTSLPRDSWQAAYNEHFLNMDGSKVIGTFLDHSGLDGLETRLVFFMYALNIDKPLISLYGDIALVSPIDMPQRLSAIVQFEETD